jgi:uncharacterized protein YndB with AHSA1/START domain
MLKKIALAVFVVVAAVLGYAALQPDTFRVSRSATIDAPPDKVYPLLADFHKWAAWSPWENRDPAMQRTFGGADSGKGATYAWAGNRDVGEGRMEITDATAPSKITIKLDFLKPFEGHDVTEFVLAPQGDATQVTWTMQGPATFMTKLMNVFASMDSMIGKDFEAGLANLKSAAK